jgi:phosphatidylglycerophosphatase A
LNKAIPAKLLRHPIHLLSLGFGSGLSPYAPGTMGTLVAIPLYLLIAHLPLTIYLGIIIVGFVLGVYFCHLTSEALGVHDHPGIVWDEVIGFWITMIAVPVLNWQWIAAGFVLFRFFDIIKPWPVKLADKRLPGGFGIMFDDVLAGIYALICMQLLHYYLK